MLTKLDIAAAILATATLTAIVLFFAVPAWRPWLGMTVAALGSASFALACISSTTKGVL